jgi:hypothetical protein
VGHSQPAHGKDQEPGNSGVYLHSLYEIQVLESNRNKTYADGQAGAIYCQYPPLVNPARPPGEWQTYDIVFHGPRFAPIRSAGTGHHHAALQWRVGARPRHADGSHGLYEAPALQSDAGQTAASVAGPRAAVRYRNIWIRELKRRSRSGYSRPAGAAREQCVRRLRHRYSSNRIILCS